VGYTKLGIDCAQLFVRGKLVRLFTVFVSSIEARQPRAAVDWRCSSDTRPSQLKEHSTLKSLCRGAKKTASIWLDTRQVRARQHRIDFARQSNEHCLARNRYPALGASYPQADRSVRKYGGGQWKILYSSTSNDLN
jgi:hypothetical protein